MLSDTVPLSSLDSGVNYLCPCLSTAAIRFFSLSPSVEADCAVTLASSKSVQPCQCVQRTGRPDGRADGGELFCY